MLEHLVGVYHPDKSLDLRISRLKNVDTIYFFAPDHFSTFYGSPSYLCLLPGEWEDHVSKLGDLIQSRQVRGVFCSNDFRPPAGWNVNLWTLEKCLDQLRYFKDQIIDGLDVRSSIYLSSLMVLSTRSYRHIHVYGNPLSTDSRIQYLIQEALSIDEFPKWFIYKQKNNFQDTLDRIAAKERRLGAVVIPTIASETDLHVKNLETWNSPNTAPYFDLPTTPVVDLIYLYGQGLTEKAQRKIMDTFERCQNVNSSFRDVKFLSADLTDQDNLYSLEYIDAGPLHFLKRPPRGGYKSGPNNLFYFMVQSLLQYPFIFQMEADCFPIRPDWLGCLERILANIGNDFWVMGSIYRGNSPLDKNFRNHINGNAIYAVGDPAFRKFVGNEFKHFLDHMVNHRDPRIAYDVGMYLYLHDDAHWNYCQSIFHKFVYTDFIQNYSGHPKFTGGDRHNIISLQKAHRHTYILHGKLLRKDDTGQLEPQDETVKARSLASSSIKVGKMYGTINISHLLPTKLLHYQVHITFIIRLIQQPSTLEFLWFKWGGNKLVQKGYQLLWFTQGDAFEELLHLGMGKSYQIGLFIQQERKKIYLSLNQVYVWIGVGNIREDVLFFGHAEYLNGVSATIDEIRISPDRPIFPEHYGHTDGSIKPVSEPIEAEEYLELKSTTPK